MPIYTHSDARDDEPEAPSEPWSKEEWGVFAAIVAMIAIVAILAIALGNRNRF